MSVEAGYFFINISKLELVFSQEFNNDLNVKIDFELINKVSNTSGPELITWLNNLTKTSSNVIRCVKSNSIQLHDDSKSIEGSLDGSVSKEVIRTAFNVDLVDEISIRSNYIDLTYESINTLLNYNLVIKVNIFNEIVTKSNKAPQSSEENIYELNIPFSNILINIGSSISFDSTINELLKNSNLLTKVTNSNISSNDSQIQLNICSDNDLCEYLNGSSIFHWNNIIFNNLPSQWSLHYKDEVPKGKIKPTLDDLKVKYIENINKLILNQEKLVKYSINIQTNNVVNNIIPSFKIDGGKANFDSSAASAVDSNENIRELTSLWQVKWPSSPFVFLHRKQIKQLIQFLKQQQQLLNVIITRTTLPEGIPIEGNNPLSIETTLDLSKLLSPGQTNIDLLSLSDFNIIVNCRISKPLLLDLTLPSNTVKSARDNLHNKAVLNYNSNKNIVSELEQEILNNIKIIANEYILLYPLSDPIVSNETNATTPHISIDNNRKQEFISYLSTNGILHKIKENLKPKIYEVIYFYYGIKGQLLNSNIQKQTFSTNNMDFDEMLNDLYVILIKHCNIVLNKLYNNTCINVFSNQYDQPKAIVSLESNDEIDNMPNKLKRLLLLSYDQTLNYSNESAEKSLLERIHITNHSNSQTYYDYGLFCLKVSRNVSNSEVALNYINKSRVVLRKALDLNISDNLIKNSTELIYIYSSLLIESQQYAEAESYLLELQRGNNNNSEQDNILLDTLNEFDGYDSDSMITNNNDPAYYSILACYFSLLDKPLHSRKAMILVTKAFKESNSQPDITLHGKPKRTLVYSLSNISIFFAKYGFIRLLNEAMKLLNLSEEAIAKKCKIRNIATTTIPFIKYKMSRALCLSKLANQSFIKLFVYPSNENGIDNNNLDSTTEDKLSQAIEHANDCIYTASTREDQIDGYLLLAEVQLKQNCDAYTIIDSYLSALSIANQTENLRNYIPVDVYVSLAKLLLQCNRFQEGYDILLDISKIHISSVVLMYLGIFSLRLDKLSDSEDCLYQANIIDSNNGEIWAYYCLLCLTIGISRYDESVFALKQCYRLEYDNVVVLREIATTFVIYNKLSVAEDIIRRCLTIETKLYNKSSNLTRKILGDILVNQNQIVDAINEYQAILNDNEGNNDMNNQDKIILCEKCLNLLNSLGRLEEVEIVNNILINLK